MRHRAVWCACAILLTAVSTHAYIGPGVGVTLIGWLIGCSVAVAAAFWAVLLWPLRCLLARLRSGKVPATSTQSSDDGAEEQQ